MRHAKQVLLQYIDADLMNHPMIKIAKGMSLVQLSKVAPAQISPKTVETIDSKLKEL